MDEPKTPYEAWRQTAFQRYGLSDEALSHVPLTSAEGRAMILRTVREEDRAEVERLLDAIATQKDDEMTDRHDDERPDLLDEAIDLYAQETEEAGAVFEQPDHNDSAVCALEGKTYVVLANVNGILAVYEVDTAYRLHRLQSWPEALGDAF